MEKYTSAVSHKPVRFLYVLSFNHNFHCSVSFTYNLATWTTVFIQKVSRMQGLVVLRPRVLTAAMISIGVKDVSSRLINAFVQSCLGFSKEGTILV